ncbi:MAG: DUF1360 domain-containing protein [Acidimicrobiales bacterium]
MKPPRGEELLVDALAVARLTHLIQQDTIPPLPALRRAVTDRWGDRAVTDLVDCPWCVSVHVAVMVALARARFPRAWPWVARVLAASTVAGHLGSR